MGEFSKLLNVVKERNIDRLQVTNNLESSISPNRHWKRGLGREGTPNGGERDSASPRPQDSALKLNDIQGRDELELDRHPHNIDIKEISKFIGEVCDNLSEKEMVRVLLINISC